MKERKQDDRWHFLLRIERLLKPGIMKVAKKNKRTITAEINVAIDKHVSDELKSK